MPSRIGGVLIPPGSVTTNQTGGKSYTPAAYYPSSSGNTAPGLPQGMAYTVCEVNDGTTSCDCMGWTRRNPPGGRTCKHTQDYEANLRSDWNQMTGGSRPNMPVPEFFDKAAQAVGAPRPGGSEKGGSLSDLLKKLDEGGMK